MMFKSQFKQVLHAKETETRGENGSRQDEKYQIIEANYILTGITYPVEVVDIFFVKQLQKACCAWFHSTEMFGMLI